MSDLPLITGAQSAAARALLGVKQVDLARDAGLSSNTIIHFERSNFVSQRSTALAVRAALEGRGIRFLLEANRIGVYIEVAAQIGGGDAV